ncbi:MAG: helix-turn-helix domain-containing protein [Pseudomonadota bacterium]|nr:helix-turn-helix domain-containing protein [Pseudomonadota bacterium]
MLQLAGDDFVEVPTALGDLQGNANAQEQVLMLLSKQVPMKCSDLVRATGKAQPQISSICKTLRERGAIDRLDDGAYQIRLTQQF